MQAKSGWRSKLFHIFCVQHEKFKIPTFSDQIFTSSFKLEKANDIGFSLTVRRGCDHIYFMNANKYDILSKNHSFLCWSVVYCQRICISAIGQLHKHTTHSTPHQKIASQI